MSNPLQFDFPDPGSGNRRGCLIAAIIIAVILAIVTVYMMIQPAPRAITSPRITDPGPTAPTTPATTQSNR